METKTIIKLSALLVGIILIIATISVVISTKNTEITKKEYVDAKQRNLGNFHNDMWTTISQKAQVSADYRSSFDTIYTHIMSERYDKGDGTLMKWITESNPTFDTSLYLDLSTTIESKRTEFRIEQTELLDVVRDYNTYISTFPNSLILNKEKIVAKMITSTRTNNALESGVDDDVQLFKN